MHILVLSSLVVTAVITEVQSYQAGCRKRANGHGVDNGSGWGGEPAFRTEFVDADFS